MKGETGKRRVMRLEGGNLAFLQGLQRCVFQPQKVGWMQNFVVSLGNLFREVPLTSGGNGIRAIQSRKGGSV